MALHIRLLGSFALSVDGAPSTLSVRKRVQELIAYLLLQRAPIPRITLASALWPDVRDEQALKNLRTLLTRLRDEHPLLASWLHGHGDLIQLHPDADCTVDLLLFEQARSAALVALDSGNAPTAQYALAEAASHYGGDFLPGHDDEWIRPERERLRRAWIDTLDQRVRLLSATGAHLQAQEVARQLLHADPLHESAYASLMRSQLALGDRAGALRTYHACAALLREELGVDPGAETQSVYRDVLFDESVAERPTKTTPAQEWSARAARTSSVQELVASAPMVGRTATMAWVRERWQAACAGAPQVVLLAGEAGIGKTRIVQELASWVERESEGEVAIARAYAAGAPAYAPIAAWLRSDAGSRRLRRTPVPIRAEITRLVPEMGSSTTVEPLDEPWRRHRFYQALATALLGERDVATSPLLLILEDAQWADAETLVWLPQLLEAAQGKPLLLLLTLRLEESPENAPLERLLAELRRSRAIHERELRRLNLEETTQLAAMLVAEQSRESRSIAPATSLFGETEGIPLFVVETVRARVGEAIANASAHAVAADALQLSPVVLATLRARIDQLSQPARALAECAAVLGREFRYRELAATSQGDEETLVRALDELWRKRIVREQGADAYDFSHDKLRSVAYSGLSNARRRMLHRRAAEAVLAARGEQQGVSAEVAAHFEEAGELEQALTYYRRAAAAAKAIFATTEAILVLRRILREPYLELLSSADQVELSLAMGDALMHENETVHAEHIYKIALDTARVLGDELIKARTELGLSKALFAQGKHDDALGIVERARITFEERASLPDLVRALQVIHEYWENRLDYARSDEVLARILRVARAIDDKERIVDALLELSTQTFRRGDLGRARSEAGEALEISQVAGYREGRARALHQMGRLETEYLDRSIEYQRDAALAAHEIGYWLTYCHSVGGMCFRLAQRGEYLLSLTGNLLLAKRHLAMGSRLDCCACMVYCGRALALGGWKESAEVVFRETIPVIRRFAAQRVLFRSLVLFAELLVDSDRLDEAEHELAAAHRLTNAGERIDTGPVDFEGIETILTARVAALRSRLSDDEVAERLGKVIQGNSMESSADASYWLWRFVPSEENRSRCAAMLLEYHARSGAARSRSRYAELTGEYLPQPPPLPDMSDLIPHTHSFESAVPEIQRTIALLVAQ